MCVQLSVWLIIVLIWSGQSVINTEYASKGRSRNMCFRSSDMPHQIFPKKLFSFLLIVHISVPSFLQQVLNWLVWKSGSLIFVFYKIVTFVWMYVCGNTCTTCAPVLGRGGGELLGVVSYLPPSWGRMSLISAAVLYTTGSGPQTARQFSCVHLPFLRRHAGIADACNHIWLFMWVAGIELRVSSLQG